MISIVFKMTIKEGKVKEFKGVINLLTLSAHTKLGGAVQYSFYQSEDDEGTFILYEQWENKKNWQAHLDRLVTILGPKAEGSILPKKLIDYFEKKEDILYKEE